MTPRHNVTTSPLREVVAVHWFARGGGIARMGPFTSQLEAVEALRTTSGDPIGGAFVWPEKVTKARVTKTKRAPRLAKGGRSK